MHIEEKTGGSSDSTVWPVVIVGPTACGKTDVAVALAERLDGEIINADSMQIYRGMDIGTAKPDQAQRERVPFHLLDVTTPDLPFTVSDWKVRAESAIADTLARGRRPIVCGGTGLYIRALLDDWSLAATPADARIRDALRQEAAQQGPGVLYDRLAQVDPDSAARLHPNDAVRIVRALEVYQVTGTPISVYQAEDRRTRIPRNAFRFGLTLPRPLLYERINSRVNEMLDMGFENEVRGLLQAGYSPALGAMGSLGYKEMTAYILGKQDYTSAVEDIKHNTRRFAKRQQTWFRADTLLSWVDVAELDALAVAALLESDIKQPAA